MVFTRNQSLNPFGNGTSLAVDWANTDPIAASIPTTTTPSINADFRNMCPPGSDGEKVLPVCVGVIPQKGRAGIAADSLIGCIQYLNCTSCPAWLSYLPCGCVALRGKAMSLSTTTLAVWDSLRRWEA